MHIRLRHVKLLLILLIGLCAVGGISAPTTTQAQEVQCPPGFHFDRLSGVGCVQDNCTSISGAHYSYTGTCICNDEYKGCYGPVDAAGFDTTLCGPFCPTSQLLSCVSHDAPCPSDAPPVVNPPSGEGPDLSALPAGVEALLKDLEEFLVGEGLPISAERSAAAAAAASALLSAWVLTNLLAGGRLGDLLQAVKAWLSGARPGAGPSPEEKASLGGVGLPGSGGKPQDAKKPEAKKVPLRQVAQPGKVPPGQAGKPAPGLPGQAPAVNIATPPAVTPPIAPAKPVPPAAPGGQDASLAPTDPAKLKALEDRFRQTVDEAIKKDFYVNNRSLVEDAYNILPGQIPDYFRGRTGGSCGDFSKWGQGWIGKHAEEIFGPGVVVDEVIISESSKYRPQVFINDPIEWLDSWITSNHAATRVILPNGESYILDYWKAVGDRQRGLLEKGAEAAYGQIFGGTPQYPEAQMRPEKDWVQEWAPKIGEPGDPAEVQNLHYAQNELRNCLENANSEEEAFDAYRRLKNPGVPPQQIETIINSYKKGGVWWGSSR